MPAISHLFLPPPALSGCIFAGIYRDIRGAGLSAEDRISHFPASPLVSVSLVLEGRLHLLSDGGDLASAAGPLPSRVVTGPLDEPVSSWAETDIVALTLGFYPDAWAALGGTIDGGTLPDAVCSAADAFEAEPEPGTGWQALCTTLDPAWRRLRSADNSTVTGIADWTRSILARAAVSGPGQSIRSIERRLKRSSGQTRRTLEFFGTFDRLHAISRTTSDRPLAEIALEAGFSDQSHMGRAVRRATGFSPARLNRAIETEEPFWCYRLLGERF